MASDSATASLYLLVILFGFAGLWIRLQWYADALRSTYLRLCRRTSHLRLWGAACWITISTHVFGQTASELERGRDLFWQALSLEAGGDWAGALARLQQVAQIKVTPQVRFHLARCKEQLGRLTEALGDYRIAEYEASHANATDLMEIRQARQNLERRVPKLVVSLGSELADATVELDGIAIGDSRLVKPTPTNPGDHLLTVRMPDGQSFVKRITIIEGATAKILLTSPPGFVYQPNRIRLMPATSFNRVSAPSADSSRVPTWAYLSGGIGAAGIVSASIIWYVRSKALDELNAGCSSDNVCPTSLRGTQKRGETASVAAPIALGIGVVGLGAAAYGFFLLPRPASPQADSQQARHLWVTFDGNGQCAGVNLSGAF